MSAISECGPHPPGELLLSLVAFKWLMSGLGWRVDLPRMQSDPVYAARCVQLELNSDSEWLRRRSVELLPLVAHCSRDADDAGARGMLTVSASHEPP
jgi:hypothetical protein